MKLYLRWPLVVAITVGAVSCGRLKRERHFEREFEKAVTTAVLTNKAVIQISPLATFAWDKLFIFHPYTTASVVDSQLGFKWESEAKQQLEYNDGFQLLVF